MDMYTENNGGFQVLEETSPFDEGYQVQGADGFASVAYQETAAEYGSAACMEEADALPVGPGQILETGDSGLYQDMVSEMEENDSGKEEFSEVEDGIAQAEISETEDASEQEETLEMKETGQAAEPETAEAETAPDADEEEDEETKRAKHEAAEAERKAEWEARQQAKKDALRKQQEELACMSEEEIVRRSMQRISTDTEKLTRRNMKDCVAEYIQTLCLEDVEFARMTMDPRKSMIHCFQYINRKAWDYVQDEMKAEGINPGTGQQGYGCDIPDDLCYQWAEDYFRDPSAKEDEEQEEKFVPKPYVGKSRVKPATKKNQEKKEKKSKAPEKKPEQEKKEEAQVTGQLSLLDMMSQGNKAS